MSTDNQNSLKQVAAEIQNLVDQKVVEQYHSHTGAFFELSFRNKKFDVFYTDVEITVSRKFDTLLDVLYWLKLELEIEL